MIQVRALAVQLLDRLVCRSQAVRTKAVAAIRVRGPPYPAFLPPSLAAAAWHGSRQAAGPESLHHHCCCGASRS